ncbi:MAG: methyltransferase [Candidatus Thorarchaeota archaeon]
MSCSQCQGIESKFDRKKAAKELEKYRKDGPDETTRILIDALKAEGVDGMTLLDVGGGVGAIQHELLQAGVSSCINAEASQAYVEATKEEANRQNHADRISHIHGNFVDKAADIPESDIVTLDRVICCYHDVDALVRTSSVLARRIYGVVYPRDTWRAKIATALENLYFRAQRNPFRTFVHPPEIVESILLDMGFERRFYHEKGIWQVVVYGRTHD